MSELQRSIAIAFPLHEADRQALRELVKQPLPAIYPDSAAQPCAWCGMTLAVGPRTVALQQQPGADVIVLCPICTVRSQAGRTGEIPVQSLGNPDSKLEDS